MAESVKVAIRVRPFNAREKAEGAELCVKMEGNMTKVWNKESNYEKEFFFDYSYWSHDGFVEDPDTGYLSPAPGSNYADQTRVFNDLGHNVLDNAWNGYHTCLFAYGQTGSGKSYSIVGYGSNKGIIPVACEEIFKRTAAANNPLIQHDIKVSMLEIYNEQVQDLLDSPSNRVKGGLKIREHPKTGVYVENLVKRTVASYEQISDLLEVGNQHRTVAATQMNATSSRAHTVLTISFTQIFHEEGTGRPLNRKQSDINLVDLAGSERASKTGATGDRLAEGSNINKSLSTLGRVISALAKNSGKSGKGEVVPYRESSLTRLLQNALGGNSKTTMIAAISPATFNVEETISTLRYADQVKAIKNKAVVNETPQEKLIRELREENERLKAMVGGGGPSSGMNDDQRKEYEALIEQLRREKEEAEMTFQQRHNVQDDLQRNSAQVRTEINVPHLQNLNEDPMLTGQIKHEITDGLSSVGRDQGNQIVLRGLGIGAQHCRLEKKGSNYTLHPPTEAGLKLMVNGEPISGPRSLAHQDRIRIGNGTFFVFVDPQQSATPDTDYEAAVKEANENEMKAMIGEKEEEMRRKEEELQQKMQEEMQRAQQEMEEQRRKLEAMMNEQNASSKEAIAKREAELFERQKQMEEELQKREQQLREKEKERKLKSRLDQLVSNSLQSANEANERASILGKPIRFKPEFTKIVGPDGTIGKGPESVKMRMRLMYPGLADSQKLYWPNERLEERLPDMAEMCQQYFDGVPIEEIDVGYDPFAIEGDDLSNLMDEGGYIGQVQLITETLFYLLEQPEEPQVIYDASGHDIGRLYVGMTPEIPGEDIDEAGYESLNDVLGKQIDLTVSIPKAEGIPGEYSKNVYCSYAIPACGRETYQTVKASGNNPAFNFQKAHTFVSTKFTSSDMENGTITINVFGSKPDSMKSDEANNIRSILGGKQPEKPPKTQAVDPPRQPVEPPQKPSGPLKQPPPKESGRQPLSPDDGGKAFVASPSVLSASVLEESKNPNNNSSIQVKKVDVSGSAVVVEDEKDRKIREMEERLKKAEEDNLAKKSGCCELF